MEHSYAVIMAGGVGTRLWPISRKNRPKQFQAFTHELTLLQHMVKLVRDVLPVERIFIMATPEFASLIYSQVPEIPENNLLYEPSRRDNGPSTTLAMLQVCQRDPEATVAILWSDHDVQEPEAFATMLRASFQASQNHRDSLVVVGAKPTSADAGLGYIQVGTEVAKYEGVPVFQVKQFIEKPEQKDANRYAASWEYLWNVGYKIIGTQKYLDIFRAAHPELTQTLDDLKAALEGRDMDKIRATYDQFPALSIEYLFTPHVKDLIVVPADIGWSDVGNWKTLHNVLKEKFPNQLVTRGPVLSRDSSNSLVFAKDRQVVLLGVKDLVVVDEGDVLLVMTKDAAGSIKELTQQLESSNPELL